MSGYDALDELYEKLRDAEETQHAQRAGGITPEAIRAARGGAVDESGRTHATAAENAAGGDSEPLAGIPRDSRERIEADAWELARLDASRTWEERRDAIVALLDRQAALTERERDKYKRHMWEYSMWHESTARMLGIGFDPENLPSDDEVQGEIERRICALQDKVDELNAQNTRLNDGWAEANVCAEKLQAELDHARSCPDCDCCGWKEKVDELQTELDACKLRERAAEDYDFRKAAEMWEQAYEGKCEELALLRAELDAHVEPPDSWERICADLRAMDEGNLIAQGNGQYVEDTRHDEIAARIERMAKA